SIWVLTKLKLRDDTAWMFGVLIGHTLWMFIGHATLFYLGKPYPQFALFLVDLVAVTALAVWGLSRQSSSAAIGVLIYQVLALGGHLADFSQQGKVPSGPYIHVALRLLGIGLAIYAIIVARRFERPSDVGPAAA